MIHLMGGSKLRCRGGDVSIAAVKWRIHYARGDMTEPGVCTLETEPGVFTLGTQNAQTHKQVCLFVGELKDWSHLGTGSPQSGYTGVYKLNEELQRGVYPCTTDTLPHGCTAATLLQP